MAQKPKTSTARKPTIVSRASAAPANVGFDELVTARVALQTVTAQLDQQAAALRAQLQLAINRSHRDQTEELLDKIDAKLEKQHPSLFKLLSG